MDFLNFVLVLSPIVVVLVGILGFHQSAKRVAPIALLWTLLLAFTYFNVTGATFKENIAVYDALIWKGIKEGLKIVLMVFGAFTILNLLRETGAIEDVKATIAQISDDRRVQVVIIGMMLAPTAMNNITTVVAGIPLWKNWLVAVVTILTIILVMFFTRGFIKLVPILIGIVVGYLLSLALGMVDTAKVAQASWFTLPKVSLPAFKNWGAVSFAITMIAPISIVTFVEHVGDITANGAVTGHNYIEDPGLHRTLLGCGLASIFSGAMGGPAATTYSENTGVLAATQNYNPATLRIAAVFAIVLSLFGKVSGVLNSIPAAVMGGVSVILFGMIASVGLRMLVENHVDFTKSYNLVIAAVMLVIGLGLSSGIAIGNVTVSGTAIAAVLGVILAKVLPQEDRENTKAAKQ